MRKLPKDVLKMASGLILPSGLAGHRRPLCIEATFLTITNLKQMGAKLLLSEKS